MVTALGSIIVFVQQWAANRAFISVCRPHTNSEHRKEKHWPALTADKSRNRTNKSALHRAVLRSNPWWLCLLHGDRGKENNKTCCCFKYEWLNISPGEVDRNQAATPGASCFHLFPTSQADGCCHNTIPSLLGIACIGAWPRKPQLQCACVYMHSYEMQYSSYTLHKLSKIVVIISAPATHDPDWEPYLHIMSFRSHCCVSAKLIRMGCCWDCVGKV